MDQGGSFIANMGRLSFSDLGEVRLIGGTFTGGSDEDEIYTGGTKVTMDALDPDRSDHHVNQRFLAEVLA